MKMSTNYNDLQRLEEELRKKIAHTQIAARPQECQTVRSDQLKSLFVSLAEWNRSIAASAMLVGKLPPSPPTPRARIGAVLAGLVRRALFWYTPQIVTTHSMTAAALSETTKVLYALYVQHLEVIERVASMESRAQLDKAEARRITDDLAARLQLVEFSTRSPIDHVANTLAELRSEFHEAQAALRELQETALRDWNERHKTMERTVEDPPPNSSRDARADTRPRKSV
jgi:hypothetical protein